MPEVRTSAARRRLSLRDLLVIAAAAGGGWVAYRLRRIVLVVILALFLAYVLAPLVKLAQSTIIWRGRARCLPRGAAIAVVYLVLAGTACGLAALLWPSAARQLDAAIASAPAYTESFRAWEHGWARYYERLRMPIELRHVVDQAVVGAGDATVAYARGALVAVMGALGEIPWLVLVPILAFLLLKDAAAIRRTMLTALPHRIQLRGHRLFEELSATLAAYIRAQLVACAVVGVLCAVGFALLGSPYAILLGVLAAVLEWVPLVGPIIVAVIAVVVAALHDPMRALWTAVFLAVLRLAEDYVIYPRLIGRDIDLKPIVIILAVLAGAELGGIAGIFISVPVVALVTVAGRHWLAWRERDAEAPQSAGVADVSN